MSKMNSLSIRIISQMEFKQTKNQANFQMKIRGKIVS